MISVNKSFIVIYYQYWNILLYTDMKINRLDILLVQSIDIYISTITCWYADIEC